MCNLVDRQLIYQMNFKIDKIKWNSTGHLLKCVLILSKSLSQIHILIELEHENLYSEIVCNETVYVFDLGHSNVIAD